jgi:hypothetical protein
MGGEPLRSVSLLPACNGLTVKNSGKKLALATPELAPHNQKIVADWQSEVALEP